MQQGRDCSCWFIVCSLLKTLALQATELVAESVAGLAGYSCTFRGNILVKGKGALPTYWITKRVNGV